ncbi:MAG: MopE-related protein, partial [Myxococcota bacterium]
MVALILLSGCLIDTDRYERRRDELLAGAEADSGPDCAPVRVWVDADGDGFGNPAYPDERCAPFYGWVEDATDCDDGDAGVNPGAEEICATPADDDCDGTANEDGADGVTVYADADGDGFGDAGVSATACVVAAGWTEDVTDCADADAGVHPGAEEVCGTGVDEDCEGGTDCRLAGEVPVGEADVVWEGVELTDGMLVPSHLGDLTGDGRDEFAVPSAFGLQVFTDPGDGTWSTDAGELGRLLSADGLHYRTSTAGDYLGDGVPDLVTAAFDEEVTTSRVHILFDGLSGTVAADRATITWDGAGGRARGMALATGDLDGDSRDELVFTDLAGDS